MTTTLSFIIKLLERAAGLGYTADSMACIQCVGYSSAVMYSATFIYMIVTPRAILVGAARQS